MYQQAAYRKEDPEYLFRYIQQHPFATLILQGQRLLATHIPVLTTGTPLDFRLFGHIAHNNEQYPLLRNGMEALLIFQGAHAYISPSWYREEGIGTWNYSAVHVNVKIRLQSQSELEASLEKLVQRFEQPQESPRSYQDIPPKMLAEHLPLIKGFWAEPFRVQGISKMSQDHAQDLPRILEELKKAEGHETLAKEMEREQKGTGPVK